MLQSRQLIATTDSSRCCGSHVSMRRVNHSVTSSGVASLNRGTRLPSCSFVPKKSSFGRAHSTLLPSSLWSYRAWYKTYSRSVGTGVWPSICCRT